MHLVTTKNDQHVNFMNNVAAYSSLIHIPNDGSINHKLRLLGISTIFTHIPMVRYSRDCGQVTSTKLPHGEWYGIAGLTCWVRNPKYRDSSVWKLYICLFDLILYVHSTIFQLCGTVLPGFWERSGSVVECLTRDRRAAGSSLTGVTTLLSLSKTHLS